MGLSKASQTPLPAQKVSYKANNHILTFLTDIASTHPWHMHKEMMQNLRRGRRHQLLWLISLPSNFLLSSLRPLVVSVVRYRDKDLKDNYCRNPDNRLRPWCYTMDPKTPWEYCNITACGKSLLAVYTPRPHKFTIWQGALWTEHLFNKSTED